ncbi:MAG: metallophosphoesterase [Candidatus Omnitrophica bacterium]|nr:metallophosphoesterase [Candidatus Omnitrophota bacterium]MBU1996030.1 metallophosphoesterase [Candidatus Omnitrophota bacterium]MBU4332976.1 metallophosphoesterase [Candidatus Omnitrophota bacterium]
MNLFFIENSWSFEKVNKSDPYHFMVVGHAYGNPEEYNLGLYPKFLYLLNENRHPGVEFIVFTGDIVRKSDKILWDKVEEQIKSTGLTQYYLLGNHDESAYARKLLTEKFGGTYYSFKKQKDVFVVFDTQKELGVIPKEQIEFLEKTIEENPKAKNFFLFVHELLWTAKNDKYKNVHPNRGYDFDSNFWTEFHPILKKNKGKKFYVVAGDVGANEASSPFFRERTDNVTILASGMGGNKDENYLLFAVNGDNVDVFFVLLNSGKILSAMEDLVNK